MEMDLAGGGGGGTFIFKIVSSSSYLYTAVSPNIYIEPLVIAAGGGGGGDQGYSGGRYPGIDASAQNGTSNTGLQATTQGASGTGGVLGSKFLSGGVGNIYGRNGQLGYGGFGCGVANDDQIGFGGGYTIGTASAGAYSYCTSATERVDGQNDGEGKAIITFK